jgi:hypothetical protein
MISPEVGLETLPNCYIKMIEIDKSTQFSDRYDCTLIIKDLQDASGKHSWYKNSYLFPHMKILCVLSADSDLNAALDQGDIPLTIDEINKAGSTGMFKAIQESLSTFRETITDEQNVEEGLLRSFNYPVSFEMQSNARNVKLYAAVVVDIQEFSAIKRVNLSSEKLKAYTGPVSSETIKDNGSLQTKTTYLQKPNGTVWSGPVHEHEGRLMEGSFHTARQHDFVQQVSIQNPKIKNYKKEKFKRLTSNRVQRNSPIFSDLTVSYGGRGNASGLFTVNIRSAILRHSFYASKIASLNRAIFDSMIGDISILNLSISKQKITTRVSQNKMGTPKRAPQSKIQFKKLATSRDDSPLSFRQYDKGNFSIEEMTMTTDISERSFSFNENGLHKEASEYRYKIDLVLDDPFKKFLDNLNSVSKGIVKQFKTYAYRADLKSLNTEGPYLSPVFIEQESIRYPVESSAPWHQAAANYVSLVSTLKEVESDEFESLLQETIFLIHPKYCTKKSLSTFSTKYSNVYMEFIKTYQVIQRSYIDSSKRGAAKNALNPKIELSKTFRDIVSYNGRDKCLHYLDTESMRFPFITKTDLDQISQAQIKKHFKNQPSFAGTILSDQSKELTEAFSDYKNETVSYINPITIQDKKKSTQVDDYKSIDLDRLNNIIDDFVPPVRIERTERVTPRPSKLSFKVAKDSKSYLADKKEKFKSVDENLGSTNPFRSADEKYEEKKSRVVNSKIKKSFRKRETQKPKKKSFSLKEPKISQKLEKNLKLVRKMPISLKSVFISESSNVKNNFLKKDDSFIENTKTSNAFRVAFQSPAKIEYISGYSKDRNGDKVIVKPQWKLLNKQNFDKIQGPVICRMSYHELKDLTNPLSDFYIANSHFILRGEEQEIRKVPNTFSLPTADKSVETSRDLLNSKIEYATSNIIQQYQDNINTRKLERTQRSERPQPRSPRSRTTGRLY